MQVSKEYEEFLKARKERYSLYERACSIAEKILPIKPWKSLQERYKDAIEFCHLRISPRGAFSLMLLATLIAVLIPSILAFVLGLFSAHLLLINLIFAGLIAYYLYDYPTHFSIVFRIKASAEMVLCIVYMTIAMRVTPNIENAVKFAAKNLTGPLARDLKQLIWNVYTRKYDSMDAALDSFIDKWSRENEEFTEAIYLIKTSVFESAAKLEGTLDEAVSVVLSGTKDRMKRYAQELRTPVTVLNALGIILPIVGLIFFPIVGIFLPEAIQPVFLILGYDILLPISVFWLMKTCLEKRPYSFHQPDISKHPQFAREKAYTAIVVSLALALPLGAFGAYQIIISAEAFSFGMIVYSLLITVGISLAIVSYTILSVIRKLKLRSEIVQIENEFAETLYQLGNQLTRGIPIETTIRNITPRIEKLEISKFFQKILYNIETFGMTLEQAIFNPKSGAIQAYPSKLIEAVMHAIVEISKRGMGAASKAMITISSYLKDVRAVEDDLRDMLSEVTSTMSIQAVLLAPLSAGVVVALAALIMKMLLALRGAFESIYGSLSGYGPVGMAGSGILGSIFNLDQMIPVHNFQLIVGIYMIEVVVMLSIFLSIIKNGDESLLKRFELGKALLLATAVYAIVLLLIYSAFSAMIPITELVT